MVGLTNISVTDFTRECAVFMLALVVVLGLITYIPGLVIFLPHLIMGK
jgi:C4-dicarboxylate transporter DctM subunit